MPLSTMRTTFVGLCAASLFGGAAAQGGPIKLLVGFPAGGGGDIVSRLVAEKLQASLATNVIVEN